MTAISVQFEAARNAALAAVHADLVATAKRRHAEVMAADPRPLNFLRHVDGVANAPEEAVRSDGIIVYDYNRLDIDRQGCAASLA
jgi:phosphoglycerate dehydrogenase-like enzyme